VYTEQMTKILSFSLLFLILTLVFPRTASAQMMGNLASPTSNSQAQIQASQDEAAGRAVWDKLQNSQTTCADLKDDDFDVLGDFFMGNMMGSNHDAMDQQMTQRLGDDGEKQMHITMGKRLSGCDVNASFPQGGSYFMPMMGLSGGAMNTTSGSPFLRNQNGMMGYGSSSFSLVHSILFGLGVVTWVVGVVFAVTGSMYFWKEIQRKK